MSLSLIFLLITVCYGSVYVYGPDELRVRIETQYSRGVIPSTLANFGNPPYGSVIVGRVYLPRHTDSPKGCDVLLPIDFTEDPDAIKSPILMLERGDCPFVIKARNAQNIGSAALILVDDIDEDVTKVMMTDNGSGGNIAIPVFMIGRADGDLIREYLKNPELSNKVALTLTFEINPAPKKVEYELWLSSELEKVNSFLHDFSKYAVNFKQEETLMIPHYVMWYSSASKDSNYTIPHPDCLSAGRYCAPDPDYDGPRSGREILLEDLRQICIYKLSQTQQKHQIWWKYIQKFSKSCSVDNFTQTCSEDIMEEVGINIKSVSNCVRDSFLGKDFAMDDNTLLSHERDRMLARGINYFPVLLINNQTFRGDLESDEVMGAICAAYIVKPTACDEWYEKFYPTEEKHRRRRHRRRHRGMGTSTLFIIVVFSFLTFGVLLFFYRRWMRAELGKEMQIEVSSAVNSYFTLSGEFNREI